MVLAGCSGGDRSAPRSATRPSTTTVATAPPTTTPPTTDAVYRSAVATVTADDLGASWHLGCPVPPESLRLVTVTFIGFDGAPNTGQVVVNADVVDAVVEVFRQLYARAVPDPQDEAHLHAGGVRRLRDPGRQLDRASPAATRSPAAVRRRGRSTRTVTPSTSTRSRTRTSKAVASSRRPGPRTPTGATSGPAWPWRAAPSSTRSARSDGAGARASATTNTSRRTAADYPRRRRIAGPLRVTKPGAARFGAVRPGRSSSRRRSPAARGHPPRRRSRRTRTAP